MELKEILNKGPKLVRYNNEANFMLSVRSSRFGSVIGIAPFAIGGKCPRHGEHKMLPAFAREDYFSKLKIIG